MNRNVHSAQRDQRLGRILIAHGFRGVMKATGYGSIERIRPLSNDERLARLRRQVMANDHPWKWRRENSNE